MTDSPKPAPRKPRWKRWLNRLAWTALVLTVGFAGFVTWALTTCFAEPPVFATRPSIRDATLTTEPDGRTRIGKSWFHRRPGRSLLHLEGDPFTIGFTNSTLTTDLLEAQERSLIEKIGRAHV
jgi:hypothetical protein